MKYAKALSIVILSVVLTVIISGCSFGTNGRENETSIITNTETVNKLFPSLEGVETVEIEVKILGKNSFFLPGPNDYRYQGYITLSDDAASGYAEDYSFTSDDPDVEFEKIKSRDGQWMKSNDFTKEIKPDYYNGNVWIDDNTILFSVNTT